MTKTPKLHTAKTNWHEYRNILDAQIKLNISLKTPEETEEGIEKLTVTLQEAARQATPHPDIQKTTKNIQFEIKKLIIEKKDTSSRHPKDN